MWFEFLFPGDWKSGATGLPFSKGGRGPPKGGFAIRGLRLLAAGEGKTEPPVVRGG